jgi:methylenetetrahydrofolate dehydrogenase (NADP+)/methenyltetrahydrofolate cyclohydrolase
VSARGAARLLQGAPIAAEIRAGVKDGITSFKHRHGVAPTLAVVIVGTNAPSAVYLEQILRSCRTVGATGHRVELSGRASAAQLRNRIEELNQDPLVSGIIVQMPLPKRIPLRTVIDTIDPQKDIDGLHPRNAGLLALGHDGFTPATAQASVEILKRSGFVLEGMNAVVIGRSNVVGKPAAQLLVREHCTVTVCHRKTRDLAREVRRADLVLVAAGHPGLVDGSMLKRGALVVDIGINVVGDSIVGDVDTDSAVRVAGAITPVPGGVGPVTNALLMEHLLRAAEALAANRHADGRGPEGVRAGQAPVYA